MLLPTVPRSAIGAPPVTLTTPPRHFMNPGEEEALIALVASVQPFCGRVVEIGVNVGRTAKAILANVPGVSRYLGVDVKPGYVPACPVQRGEIPERPGELVAGDKRFELILRPRGSLDLAPADLLGMGGTGYAWVDAMFIDGDHGAAAVCHDTRLAHACVRPGGIVIWHDYHDLGTVDVRAVLDDLFFCGARLQHVENTWLVFERR
jgi:predicted O-methyltransferase YrrM